MEWSSPDGKIKKYISIEGEWGLKPTENCLCKIEITDYTNEHLQKCSNISEVTIGDTSSSFERLLHNCLFTMHKGEKSSFIVKLGNEGDISFTLSLLSFQSNGLIYEWDARTKCDLALKHKIKGNDLYNALQYVEASHRFGKALKILCSIPIEVDDPPSSVDNVDVTEIYNLKSILYNNLASCYIKHNKYESVMALCEKVLAVDGDNVKALYKQGIAKSELRDYEGAHEVFQKVIGIEPTNKAALLKLKYVNSKIAQSNAELNTIIKKMFSK